MRTYVRDRPAHVRFAEPSSAERCGWLRTQLASSRTPLQDALQLVHLYAERGSPKFEPAARRGLVRYLTEGTPSLKDVAKVTPSLAKHRGG